MKPNHWWGRCFGGGGRVGGEINATSSELVSSLAALGGVRDLECRRGWGLVLGLDVWTVGTVSEVSAVEESLPAV